MSEEAARERARTALEDAVYRMLEAGFSADEVKAECEYAIESAEE
jgi:DNA-binding transcriptional regulator YhcF (GntR family)